jgi:hypothetical protein
MANFYHPREYAKSAFRLLSQDLHPRRMKLKDLMMMTQAKTRSLYLLVSISSIKRDFL